MILHGAVIALLYHWKGRTNIKRLRRWIGLSEEEEERILCAILNYPTAAILIVPFWIYIWRDRQPY